MPKRSQSYNAWQMERLSRPRAAASFLNAARKDSLEMFLVALRKVAQAHQMVRVAKEANIQRETLYHALSEEGNPTLATLDSVLAAVGLRFEIMAREPAEFPSSAQPRRPFNIYGVGSPAIGDFPVENPAKTTAALSQGLWFKKSDTITAGYMDPAAVGSLVETSQSLIIGKGLNSGGECNYGCAETA